MTLWLARSRSKADHGAMTDGGSDTPSDDSSVVCEASLVERNYRLFALCASPSVVVLVVFAWPFDKGLVLWFVGALVLLVGLVGAKHAWQMNLSPRARRVQVRVDGESLWLGDLALARSTIEAGYNRDGLDHVRVLLKRVGSSQPLELRVDTEAEANRLLRALDLDPASTVVRFSTLSRGYHFKWTKVMVVSGLGISVVAALVLWWAEMTMGALAVVLIALALARLISSDTLTSVGADGLKLRWLGRERFVAHRSIRKVSATTSGGVSGNEYRAVVLGLDSGETLTILVSGVLADLVRTAAHARRIEEAIAAQTGEPTHAEVLSHALATRDSGVSMSHWLAALRQLPANHRKNALTPELLWRILEDPRNELMKRAAAAISLGDDLDDQDATRLQRIAKVTAQHQLRVVFEDVAAARDDAAIIEAVAALDALEQETAVAEASR